MAAFLGARLDEDEAVAAAASRFPRWHAEPWYDGEFLKDGRTERADLWGNTGMQFTGQGALSTVVIDHIARHDPGRVLREVEAQRAILAAYESVLRDCASVGDPARRPRLYGEHDGLRMAVAHLAGVYSGHPDYQPEWNG